MPQSTRNGVGFSNRRVTVNLERSIKMDQQVSRKQVNPEFDMIIYIYIYIHIVMAP